MRQHSQKVLDEAVEIARRLRETDVTQAALMQEYRCGHRIFMQAICSQISPDQWDTLRQKRLARSGAAIRSAGTMPQVHELALSA